MFNSGKVVNKYPGRESKYKLTCKCGAVELYPYPEGVTATTQRCPCCKGLAFGLRKREWITSATKEGTSSVPHTA